MYRYRYTRGVSRFVLERFNKHKDKLGTILKVQAKRYRVHKTGITHEVLYIKGTNGTARFSGCCWDYPGTGPRVVCELLKTLGFSDDTANQYAFHTPRLDQPGIDWQIPVQKGCWGIPS